jgi:hypothetical protein
MASACKEAHEFASIFNDPIRLKGNQIRLASVRVRFTIRVFLLLTLLLCNAGAFALLGPYASWMDQAKSYQQPGDIGGPMNINEGYRWNVPVITYGFDRSFLDYFGSNGVTSVEAAIQTLNQLPPASVINLTNFPADAWRVNYQGQALALFDLKSTVLSLLLEQMGLAKPERYAFCIRDFSSYGTSYDFYVIRRNFDQTTAQPSQYVNDTLLSYQILQLTASPPPIGIFCDAIEFPVDPGANFGTTVAGFATDFGWYAANLSRDDVGGLRYLLSGNQVRHESLLPDVHETGGATSLVRSAYRPGIEKINFVRHPAGALSGAFQPFTNQWADVYYAGDYPAYQAVERITTQPDILFTTRDLGVDRIVERTSTTNWANNADMNGNWGGTGPGVIQPPITIALNNVGALYLNFGPFNLDEASNIKFQAWGSFDGTTNAVIVYPAKQSPFQPTQVQFRLMVGGRTNEFRWYLNGMANGRFIFQSSTNLTNWDTLATLTNSGAAFQYTFVSSTNEFSRFFRTTPN